ncbi:MAG TPA: hypothetical protein VEJ63_17310 [Planctomycetota bacterium]|nr:hypothetical protein [Planctomycetota bacterium]
MTLWDRLVIGFKGGVRVKLAAKGASSDEAIGKLKLLPPDRALLLIRSIAPEAVGTVDVNCDGERWIISVSGQNFPEGFEQRFRNILVNK